MRMASVSLLNFWTQMKLWWWLAIPFLCMHTLMFITCMLQNLQAYIQKVDWLNPQQVAEAYNLLSNLKEPLPLVVSCTTCQRIFCWFIPFLCVYVGSFWLSRLRLSRWICSSICCWKTKRTGGWGTDQLSTTASTGTHGIDQFTL